jgi:hypothetical protein
LTAQTLKQDNKLWDDLASFFVGTWSGSGAFANGKKIAADVTFKLSLDSSWIIYEHTDKKPNRYKAISMWGVDPLSGEFTAYLFDNFHGHRKFASDGWKEGKLVLTTHEFYPPQGLRFQHFIFYKLSDKSFKMTYETSRDGMAWNLGDYLIFTRR